MIFLLIIFMFADNYCTTFRSKFQAFLGKFCLFCEKIFPQTPFMPASGPKRGRSGGSLLTKYPKICYIYSVSDGFERRYGIRVRPLLCEYTDPAIPCASSWRR